MSNYKIVLTNSSRGCHRSKCHVNNITNSTLHRGQIGSTTVILYGYKLFTKTVKIHININKRSTEDVLQPGKQLLITAPKATVQLTCFLVLMLQ